jgi:hypothetical protein
MVRKPKTSPRSFTSHENFLYLLTELELVVGSGKIEWSAVSAITAQRRLDRLSATVRTLATQLEGEQ